MAQRFDFIWEFPLPRVHTGMLLGNGRMGVMVWGGANVLHLSIGRADWWDHRGGKPWTDRMNCNEIGLLLKARDETGLRAIFADASTGPTKPTLVPVGRVDLHFSPEWSLTQGRIDRFTGVITLEIQSAGLTKTVTLELAMDRTLVRISTAGLPVRLTTTPAYVTAGSVLAQRGFEPPAMIDDDGIAGFVQPLPEDHALALAAVRRDGAVWISTELGGDEAIELAKKAYHGQLRKTSTPLDNGGASIERTLPKSPSRMRYFSSSLTTVSTSLPD